MKRPSAQSLLKTCLQAMALAGGLLCSAFSSAELLNGDFSAGFAGWQGELFDGFSTTTGTPVTNFDASSGAAVISDDDTNWAVTLFQDFTVQSLLAPGNTLSLDLDFSAATTNPFDFVVAELVDLGGALATIDISTGPIDITAWAGQSAQILFYLEDGDFLARDSLTIDNISITQSEASVPEPASLLLFLGAGLGLAATRQKRKA